MLTFLASCADDSPVSSLEEEIADDKYDVQTEINSDKNNYYSSSSSKKYSSSSYVSESEKCRLGTSSYSDSYCCSNYGYQCGIAESKTMEFTLTRYEQKTSGWDGLQNAGDPEVYFYI